MVERYLFFLMTIIFYGLKGIEMKEREFNSERINQLAQEYVRTSDDAVFERLMLEELEPLINVQLGRNYTSIKDFWEDMRQEMLLYLWKNRKSVKTTKSKVYYGWYWKIIRAGLNYIVNKEDGNGSRKRNGHVMKLQNYDFNRDNIFYFNDLSLLDKINLGIDGLKGEDYIS